MYNKKKHFNKQKPLPPNNKQKSIEEALKQQRSKQKTSPPHNTDSSPPDIPGYFYDPQKKAYFPIKLLKETTNTQSILSIQNRIKESFYHPSSSSLPSSHVSTPLYFSQLKLNTLLPTHLDAYSFFSTLPRYTPPSSTTHALLNLHTQRILSLDYIPEKDSLAVTSTTGLYLYPLSFSLDGLSGHLSFSTKPTVITDSCVTTSYVNSFHPSLVYITSPTSNKPTSYIHFVPTTFSFQYPFTYDLHGCYSSLSFNPGSSSYLLFNSRSCLCLDDLSLQQKYILSHPLSSSITSHATLSHPSFSHCTFLGLENGWILQYDDRERFFHKLYRHKQRVLSLWSPSEHRSHSISSHTPVTFSFLDSSLYSNSFSSELSCHDLRYPSSTTISHYENHNCFAQLFGNDRYFGVPLYNSYLNQTSVSLWSTSNNEYLCSLSLPPNSYNMYSTTSLLLTYHDLHSFLLVASKSDGFFLGSLDSNDHVHTIESVQ